MTERTFDYLVLRAMPDAARFEFLNAGIVVFDGANTSVRVDSSKKRLPALHPDFGRINLSVWAAQIQDELRNHPAELQRTMLPMLCSPFTPDKALGQTIGIDAGTQADFLFDRLVARQNATLSAPKTPTIRHTKLIRELRDWFKGSKVFSTKIEDLSNHRIIANYPVDPQADLYADFALMNGKLHIMETLDLRDIDRLTPTLRGDAAIKGITLDEAAARENANAIAIIAASDFGIARPAISMISRFAKDVYDLSTQSEQQRLADFVAASLHRDSLDLPLQLDTLVLRQMDAKNTDGGSSPPVHHD